MTDLVNFIAMLERATIKWRRVDMVQDRKITIIANNFGRDVQFYFNEDGVIDELGMLVVGK